MGSQIQQKTVTSLLSLAGIEVNGKRPWDITVHDTRLYSRVLREGSLGLGEAYMDGWWDTDALDEFFTRVLVAHLDKKIPRNVKLLLHIAAGRLLNAQRKSNAFIIGEAHYDIGNDLYEAMLGSSLTYTCGYWDQQNNLNAAQEAKFDLVCRKLALQPGKRILDIGCGWGSFLKFAAIHYGIQGVGITVSKEQAVLARKLTTGLPIDIRLEDYRDIKETFDYIISLGMFEHVGVKNYRTYMEIVHRCLADNGLFLLHTIGSNKSIYVTDPWIHTYIFPNSMLPSIAQIGRAIENLFVMEDWHNFGADYDKTLMAWFKNFHNAWPRLEKHYRERFYRMWKYYLLSCAGSFRSRENQLWQIVLSKNGVPGGYQSLR